MVRSLKNGYAVATRVNFNPRKPMQRFKDWKADLMARERGIVQHTEHTSCEERERNRLMCSHGIGAPVRGETLAAKGAYEPVKGGVIPGGSRVK